MAAAHARGEPELRLVLAVNTTIWGAWFLLLIGLVPGTARAVAEGVLVVVANIAMGVVAPLVWEKLDPYQQRRSSWCFSIPVQTRCDQAIT